MPELFASNWLLLEVTCVYTAAEVHSEARVSQTRISCPIDLRGSSLLHCFYGKIKSPVSCLVKRRRITLREDYSPVYKYFDSWPTVSKLRLLRVPASCLGCCNGLSVHFFSLILSCLGKFFYPSDHPVGTMLTAADIKCSKVHKENRGALLFISTHKPQELLLSRAVFSENSGFLNCHYLQYFFCFRWFFSTGLCWQEKVTSARVSCCLLLTEIENSCYPPSLCSFVWLISVGWTVLAVLLLDNESWTCESSVKPVPPLSKC